jgi:steroid 5-alpha reductase family enzyme
MRATNYEIQFDLLWEFKDILKFLFPEIELYKWEFNYELDNWRRLFEIYEKNPGQTLQLSYRYNFKPSVLLILSLSVYPSIAKITRQDITVGYDGVSVMMIAYHLHTTTNTIISYYVHFPF